MLPNPTKSQTNTVSPATRCEKRRTRPTKMSGQLERLETIEKDCFVSSEVISEKKDKTVKIALDARNFNESCVTKRPQMTKIWKDCSNKYPDNYQDTTMIQYEYP